MENVPKIFRNPSEIIQSTNYPGVYPHYLNQEFAIVGPTGSHIEITFLTFNTELNYDFLKVRALNFVIVFPKSAKHCITHSTNNMHIFNVRIMPL